MTCPSCESTRVKKLHNGVCRRCKDAFDKRHRAVVIDGKAESPVIGIDDLPNHAQHAFAESNHFADGEAVAVTMPEDFAALDSYLAQQPESDLSQASEVLREVFTFCFGGRTKTPLKTAAARFAAVTSGLRPEILSDASRTEIAAELGRTKACLSKISVQFEARFGFKFARSRSLKARQHMAKSQLGHAPTNTKKRTSNQTVTYKPAEAGGQAEGAL